MFHVSFNTKNNNWGMLLDPCDVCDKALKNIAAALERKSFWRGASAIPNPAPRSIGG